ncbi:GNAT family N-acetyltransferase [Chitinophaga sedimenti]|uniref:GNAT family N-acetyltransferase n=1 Tax=Chitinophaga sedimenti TaxID=2033606 RepID=UPI002003927D|nr:GNAT family N-acetyltransferase [Chitinophaga sedimenti]MCK7559253.1 GNAT family N-acetyltransferase [Chitinophaga sedimenti]
MFIRKATTADYPEIMRVWESSVLATHHFLAKTDFEYFKSIIPGEVLPSLTLYVIGEDRIAGVLGIAGDTTEMLFIEAESRGKGYGTLLAQFAIELQIKKVDVNEQNEQAVGFYRKMGFVQVGRSDVDGLGKPYPLLHFSIQAI